MLIVSQDPGKKTGIATWSDEDITMALGGEVFIPKGFHSFEATVDEYFLFMAKISNYVYGAVEDTRFVSESFIITVQTAKNTQAGWSLELIGVMKYIAKLWFKQDVTLQAPNIGKTFGTDTKLRHMGWYTKGAGHANDAARHLMTYAAQRGLIFDTETLKGLALA